MMEHQGAEPVWLDVQVTKHWAMACDTVGLELVAIDGRKLPAFAAGAHINVLTPNGLLRPYSLCGSSADRSHYRIAVRRERHGRGASMELHDQVKAGTRLRIRAPKNDFELKPGSVYAVLMGGGIGVAPLIPMAETLWRRGSAFELHYSARHPGCAAFETELLQSPFLGRVRFHWSETRGHLDFRKTYERAPSGTDVYVCGPSSFIDAALRSYVSWSGTIEHWHVESFGEVTNARAHTTRF